ncbi:hypothetical protein LV779_39205 [Streptomyces thinghirensis]|nr:hypothetical protein [Streptomyces thinghirensis]
MALLAVQASGAAYVPLDPAHPQDRLAYMAEDAGLHLLLTHSGSGVALAVVPPWSSMHSGSSRPALAPARQARVRRRVRQSHTSGSTAADPRASACRTACLDQLPGGRWPAKPGFRTRRTPLLALTTVCFDISGLELYLPLVTGGTVEVLVAEDARDGLRLR